MKHAVRIPLFALLVCLLPSLALAQADVPATTDLVEELEQVDKAQQNTDQAAGAPQENAKIDDHCSETLESLSGTAGANYMGICHFLNPPRYCVDYDGTQGGLCPPTCIAPGGGCGYCDKNSSTGICHCSY